MTRFARATRGRVPALAVSVWLLAVPACDLGELPSTYATPGAPVGAGDVDGDGHADIVTAGSTSEFGVLLGDGAGGFAPATVPHVTDCDSGDPTWSCSALAVRAVPDVDGDGLADVVVSYELRSNYPPPDDWHERHLSLRLADGAGSFGPPRDLLNVDLGAGEAEPAWLLADVTSDGLADLVTVDDPFSSTPPLMVRVRPGDGAGGFGAETASAIPADHPIATPQVADLDADGHADLVLTPGCLGGSGEDYLRACLDVSLGDGSGAFASFQRTMVPAPEIDGVGAAFGDLDEDGDLDVIGGAQGSSFDGGGPVGQMLVFHNDGTGKLAAPVAIAARTETVDVQLGDFDSDGHLDLLTRTENPDEMTELGRLLFGDGADQFGDLHVLPSGKLVVADFDADGRPDVAAPADGGTAVLMNRWTGRPG